MDTTIIIIISVAVVFLLWVISTSNWFKRTEVKIDEASGGIESALQRRHDELTQAYELARDYLDEEVRALIETTKYRSGMTIGELSETNERLNQCISALSAVAEEYPQLAAASQYEGLQHIVRETEEDLQACRRIYNNNVSIFNQKRVSFPSSLIGGMLGMQKKEFFKADESARKRFEIPRKK